MDKKIHVSRPLIPKFEEVEDQFKEIFESKMITECKSGSKYGKIFKEKISKYCDVPYVELLPNCTIGLMIAMKALELPLGSEVIVPSYTYSATVASIVWNGLKPRFVDIDKTCTMNPEKVREAINYKTSAILGVHLYGNPCAIKEIWELANEETIPIIWDSAHAFGSRYKTRPIGGFNQIEVFSLAASKLVTSGGEGGCICTSDEDLYNKIYTMKWMGIIDEKYSTHYLGLSGRMCEMQAIVGLKSLEILNKNIIRRHEIAKIYKQELDGLVDFMEERERCDQSYYILPIFTNKRDKIHEALKKENIESRKDYFYPALHEHPIFKEYAKNDLSITEEISRKVLAIPMHGDLSDEDVMKICKIIKKELK